FQAVGETADVVVELAIADSPDLVSRAVTRLAVEAELDGAILILGGDLRLALPQDGDLVTPPLLDLAVETVVRQVGLPADEPLGIRAVPLQHLVPFLKPVQRLGLVAPESLRVVDRLEVHPVVFLARFDAGLAAE